MTAWGYRLTENRFRLLAGSTVAGSFVGSCPEFVIEEKYRLLNSGSIIRSERGRFPDDSYFCVEDITISSPSTAAMVVSGNSRSGNEASWKDDPTDEFRWQQIYWLLNRGAIIKTPTGSVYRMVLERHCDERSDPIQDLGEVMKRLGSL